MSDRIERTDVYVGSEASMVLLYWGGIGLLGGLTGGYIVGGRVSTGAVHGGIATVFGSLVVLTIATFTTLLFGGLVASFSVLALGSLMLVFYAIPGAVGGALDSWAKHRRAGNDRHARLSGDSNENNLHSVFRTPKPSLICESRHDTAPYRLNGERSRHFSGRLTIELVRRQV